MSDALVSECASMCRLCLNKDELIYTFDDRLANGHQLRMCILLCTGVQITEEDNITQMVCHKCCSLAVKLYQYRQTALANDKALKDIANQPFEEPPTNKDNILELHNSILENISQCKISETVAQVYKVPLDDITQVDNDDKVTKEDAITENEDCSNSNSITHESVKEIFQYFPTAVVPREILDSNVLPSVPVDRDIRKYTRSEYEVIPADNSDGRVLKFKRKYPSADVVKLAVKKPRREEHADYFSDSDSSIPPAFKSRKKFPNIESDASYSDCDSDAADTSAKLPLPPPPPTTPTESQSAARPSRSKVPKNPLQFPDSDSDNESSNKKPANTKYCEICDRTFWGWSQLKSHQRTHLKCIVCRIICDSQEDLEYHVKNVCYKNIEYNQPFLALQKVDEDYFAVHKYRDAFDRYYQDVEDGVYGPTEPPTPPDPEYPYYHTEEYIKTESEFIQSVFDKYKHLDNTPIARNKVSQTRRAETHIKYYSRNQIVLQDMYKDLSMYKVPINVVVNPRVSAHISFASKPRYKDPVDRWSVDDVIDTVVKQKDPTFFLRPKKPPVPKSVGQKMMIKAASKSEKHPKLMKALTAGTSSATASTSTVTTSTTAAGGSNEKGKSYNIAKLLSTTTTSSQTNVPKSVMSNIKQLKMPTKISSEVSLVKKKSASKSTANNNNNNNAPVYANIMFRLPITTQGNTQQLNLQRPMIHQTPPQRTYQRQPVQQHQQQTQHQQQPQHQQHQQQSQHQQPPSQQQLMPAQQSPIPYIKEDPDLLPPLNSHPEMPPTPPKLLHPPPIPPPAYPNIPFKLPTPPVHNQNDLYLKQEKDIEDNLSYNAQPQMNRTYQNHSYRMPLTKPPPPHMSYNHHQPYPAQPPPRFRPPDRRNANVLNSQQYYSVNHHQNGMRYRSVSGGNMMVLPNSSGSQEGSLLSQIPPPPSLNPMPATHLLQSMNHLSNNLGHRSPINHHQPQQNHMNPIYMNSPKPPTIGKMSPISSVPSPIHSVPSPINSNPMNSPINTMPPPLNSNYNNNTYNANPSLYDHSYADTFSSTSTYPDSYSSSSTYLPPQQYIPPYSPHSHMDIDPFVDQMLQRAAGADNKMALRVKQPWELNQT